MPTYATQADCLDYIPGLVIDNPTEFDKLIVVCERDIDNVTAARPMNRDSGQRWDPTKLTAFQARQLKFACCAQVQYRLAMGPDFFVQPQYKTVRGPDFTTEGVRPTFGPAAQRELGLGGLYSLGRTGGRARP